MKSTTKVDITDGEYIGVWTSSTVYIHPYSDSGSLPKKQTRIVECFVSIGIKSMGTKVKVDVIDGWAYINLTLEDKRDLKLNILTKN